VNDKARISSRVAVLAATLGVAAVIAGCATPAVGPQCFETPQEAPVNSWWLPTPDGGVVVVDTLRTFSDARAAINRVRATGQPVHAILITHGHPDHVTTPSVIARR
jgi:glyoxylase-like metal-dependent hydrolase (beta-lactamase superfamily II)